MIPLDQQTSSIRDSSSWRINAKNEFIVHKKYQETSKWMAQEQFYCMPTREMPGSNQSQSDVVWCATYPHSIQKDLGQAAAGPEELIKMPQRQPQIDAFLFRTCLTAQFCRWTPLQSTVSLDHIQNSVAEVQHFWQCFWVKSVSPTFFWWLNSFRRNSRIFVSQFLLVKFRWFLGELRRNHQVIKSWSPGRGRGKGKGRGRGASGGYLGYLGYLGQGCGVSTFGCVWK